MKKDDRPLRFHIIITGRALLADVIKLPTGREEIRWRGVLSKGENFGDESKRHFEIVQILIFDIFRLMLSPQQWSNLRGCKFSTSKNDNCLESNRRAHS